ncbi:FimD/PapC N-terminal domain-containing protein, partial [Klebsiella pneumoniae]
KNIVASLIAGLFFYSNYVNADSIQFNQDALSISGDSDIDLSAFEHNSVAEGSYFSNISVNGKRVNFLDKIDFLNNNGKIQPCIPQKLVELIGLKEEF